MCRILIAFAFLFVAARAPAATGNGDVMAPVQQLFDSFNKGDATTAAAGCSSVEHIIDDFPPYEWHGLGACAAWMSGYKSYAAANGISDMIVALSKPRHIDVTGEFAYVVVPANYTLKKRGKVVTSTNSIVTVALRKEATGWRIIGWAWADA